MNAEMMRIARLAGLRKDPGCDREYVGDFDWRLFGDLIVANCAKVVDDSIAEGTGIDGDVLKDYFGAW